LSASPSAVRPVDEPFGHELKAEWLRSSRSGPNGSSRVALSKGGSEIFTLYQGDKQNLGLFKKGDYIFPLS
jgi:hypothetical protein